MAAHERDLPAAPFDRALTMLSEADAVNRIWQRDVSLWSSDQGVQAKIADRLGWLNVAGEMRPRAEELMAYGRELRDAGVTDVIVLGMGGSSLCVEVLRLALGPPATPRGERPFPALAILDTTDPPTIRELTARLDLATTLFIVASKSGGTLETLSHAAYFYDLVRQRRGDAAGDHFIAITDPGSKLEAIAKEQHYRRAFLNPPDIGGRYSVLSYFGLVPAALAGLDVVLLLERAMAMAAMLQQPVTENPGARLGAAMGGLARAGRDKLTIVTEPSLVSFGAWAEQLIAESTGKGGHGIVPIADETIGPDQVYGDDRLFVALALRDSAGSVLPESFHQPLIQLDLNDRYDLGGQFLLWEFATAIAGQLLGINPFDEPNVQESKDNTNRILDEFAAQGRLPEPPVTASDHGIALVAPEAAGGAATSVEAQLADFLGQVRPGDYLAVMAYIAATPEHEAALQELRIALRDRLRVATTVGYGPRFLHSTGQLHKGGANTGVFIQCVAPAVDGEALPIPGAGYGFGTLKAAQALGDFQSLIAHGRRALRIDLGDNVPGGLRRLTALTREQQ